MNRAILLGCLLVSACGTTQLGSYTGPPGRSQQSANTDNWVCEQRAKEAIAKPDNQAADFALGFTLVGLPVAVQKDHNIARETWQACMRDAGYTVRPPS